ncbi:MAG: diguanylate cyclase domain-containing protein [Eubacterium sp.]
MKLIRRNRILLIIVGIILLAASFYAVNLVYRSDITEQKENAEVATKAYAQELERDFQNAVDKSSALKNMIVKNHGKLDDFQETAGTLMTNNVSLIELAPGGVITETYPSASTSSGVNLNIDKSALEVMNYARKKNEPVLFGPFTIKSTGECVAVTNPVYLKTKNNGRKFWGYVILAVKVPGVYEHTLKSLHALGYQYNLSSTVSPLLKKPVLAASSLSDKGRLEAPVRYSFTCGDCRWTLGVEPKGGWTSEREIPYLIFGIVLTVAVEGLLYLLLRTGQQDRKLRKLAYQDTLTGLLSRGGFMHQLDRQIQNHPETPVTAVFLDLDDFKVINDVYGHNAGDQALIHISEYLKQSFPKGTLIGRTGGDEICAAVINHSHEQTADLIQKIIADVQKFTYAGREIPYSISAGFADYPAQAESRSQLIILADEALYAAKIGGKHEARYYESYMSQIKREHLGFSVHTLASGIPGAFLIYKSDPQDEEILFANNSLIQLLGCRDFDDLLHYTGARFSNFIHPDDRERVEQSIWKQINRQKEQDENQSYYEDYVEYQIVTKQGRVIPVIDVGRLVSDESYGDVFFVFIYERGLIDDRMAAEACSRQE